MEKNISPAPRVDRDKRNPDILSCIASLSNDEVFTPPEIAKKMLDMIPSEIFSNPNVVLLDPASKSGIFPREAALRFFKGLESYFANSNDRASHILMNQVHGYAISRLAFLLARRTLYCSSKKDGIYSLIKNIKNWEGNILFDDSIKHSFKHDICSKCGISSKVDENSEHAYLFTHKTKGEEKVKFDIIVGNPPYQIADGSGGLGTSAKPVYHHFVLEAIESNPRYIAMIIPARWYSTGKGLEEFRGKMLADKRIRKIVDFPDSRDCFKGVNINGGVMYFLWDRNYNGDCEVTYKLGSFESTKKRPLIEEELKTSFDDPGVFLRDNETVDLYKKILRKCKEKKYTFMSDQVSPNKPFGIRSNFSDYSTVSTKKTIPMYTLVERKRKIVFVASDIVKWNDTSRKWMGRWKVLISKAGSAGIKKPDPVTGVPFIANPEQICSETYLVISSFGTKEEAEWMMQYVKTRFFRFMLMAAKNSQNVPKGTYKYVPFIPFSGEKLVDETAYRIFDLSQEEIKLIESRVKKAPTDSSDEDVELERDSDD